MVFLWVLINNVRLCFLVVYAERGFRKQKLQSALWDIGEVNIARVRASVLSCNLQTGIAE